VRTAQSQSTTERLQPVIERVNSAAAELAGDVTVIYLEDYGMSLAGIVVAGVDVWLNNPVAPNEASGTSGMKAAPNGVPSLSVLDGWLVEGHIEGVTAGPSAPIWAPRVTRRSVTQLPTQSTRLSSTGSSPRLWRRCTTTAPTSSLPSAASPWP
jgi:Carbohydrate phosphorylase